MSFASNPTWWFLLGLWCFLTLLLAAYEAFRDRLIISRHGQSAGIVGGAVLTMWLIVFGLTAFSVSWMGAMMGLIICGAAGFGAMKGISAMTKQTRVEWMSRMEDDCQAEAKAILDTLQDANVKTILKELHVTGEKLRELYSHLRRLGLEQTYAHSALADAELLKRYFGEVDEAAEKKQASSKSRRKGSRHAA